MLYCTGVISANCVRQTTMKRSPQSNYKPSCLDCLHCSLPDDSQSVHVQNMVQVIAHVVVVHSLTYTWEARGKQM